MRQYKLKPGMGKAALPLALAAMSAFPPPSPSQAASVTGAVHWDQPTGITTGVGAFGMNTWQGFDPAVAGTPGNATYKTNVATMKPGMIRYHYAGAMNDSTTDRQGWVVSPTTSSYHWDTTKINNAMSGSYSYNPVRMVDIVNWPAYLDDGSGHLKTTEYTNYANFCAALVRELNVTEGRGVKYFELFNEKENGTGSAYDNNMGTLATVFNQCAAAMKTVDSTIKVGGPAFARPDLTYNLDAFFATTAPNLDFVSYHTYASGSTADSNQSLFNTAAGWGGTTSSMKTEFAKYSSRSIEYFHDEFNISWNPPDGRMNNEVGMIFDALAMQSIINAGVTGTLAWNEADGWYGKLDASYNMRPSAFLYQVLNSDGGGAVSATSVSDSTKLALFGTKAGTWVHLLLINRSEAAQTVQLTISGLPGGANSSTSFTTKQVGNWGSITYGSATLGTLTSATGLSMPANTVTMLVLDTSTIGGGTPPPTPAGLTATAGNAQVSLGWSASTGATSYNVKRSTVSGGGYATVSSPTTTSYTNTGLTNGTTYYYVVSAVSSGGESANSVQASATPVAPPTNIALNKTASADSTQIGHAPSAGNDGNNTTRWTSNDGAFPHWWKVDLGASYNLTSTNVMFEGSSLWKYKIEVSPDNTTWTMAVDKTANTVTAQSYVNTFTANNARYVRITVTGAGTGWWASIFEMQVFGTAAASPNLITNPGFESGLTNWGTGTGVIVTTAHTGTKALQMATGNAGQGDQTITGWIAGATYTFSGWSIQTGSGSAGLTYWVGGTKTIVWLPDGGSTFTSTSVNVTLPAGTTSVTVGFWNNWGTQTYDDLSLVKQ